MVIPIQDSIYELINIKTSKEIKNKVVSFLNYDKKNDTVLGKFDESIMLRNINFKNDEFSLYINNLTFNKGNKYAIIGPTGSGKSTLLKLILGHYRDYEGSIYIDGNNITSQDCSYIISDINQNTFLFNDTGFNNITLFKSYQNTNLDNYIKILKAESLINKDLGEFGNNISGGEKNKIAILRALCKGCNVLLCDEIFANLDDESKEDINNFLLCNDEFTVISVTHDISKKNLSQYDEIIVLNQGELKGVIKKDELDNLFKEKDYFWN